jgi:hypothetical protein
MWSQHRWIRAGFVLFVLGAVGLTWAALGDFSRATDAAPPQPTCGCAQVDSAVVPHLAATGDVGVRVDLSLNVAALEDGESRKLAIPAEVQVVINSTFVVVTGPPAGASTVQCAPGFPFQHNAVVLDPGGAHAAERTEIVIYQLTEEPVPAGTRFRITEGPSPCNTDYLLYIGTVE